MNRRGAVGRKKTELQDAPPSEDMELVGPPAPEPQLAAPELRIMAAPPPETELDEKLVRLEQALAKLSSIEEKLAVKAEAPPPSGPTLLGTAATLAGGAASLVLGPGKKPPEPNTFADAVAELRASYLMFVDPRYNLTWLGRFAPLALLAMFFFPWVWVPFAWLTGIGWIFEKIGQLVVGWVFFKVVVHEARRYRATAPDLPASLRLKEGPG